MDSRAQGMASGVSLRPAGPSDGEFLKRLYGDSRGDLRLIDGEPDFVEHLVELQYRWRGAGHMGTYPDAQEYVIEKAGDRIGRVLVNFGANTVHLLDIALIPAAQGQGYGHAVLHGLQLAAANVRAPLSLCVLDTNTAAIRLYESLGFMAEERYGAHALMVWYPPGEARHFVL